MSEMYPELEMPDVFDEGLRYINQFTPLIGELAIGQKARLTPEDKIIDKAEIRPLTYGLESALNTKVNNVYVADNEKRWRYAPNKEVTDEGLMEDWLIGHFAGKLSNLEITRLPDEEVADVRDFFRKVMKKSVPTGRGLCERTLINYALSVDKKSTGRSPLTSVARIGYYVSHSVHATGIRGGFRVIEDRSVLDLKNAIDTARMLESVQTINTASGGTASPR